MLGASIDRAGAHDHHEGVSVPIQDHPEFESRRAELEEKWAITWEVEFKKKPSPEELRAHPQYEATLQAWLAGYGIEDS
jgi:hypothetical protein